MALGIDSGDEVITPPFTFVATAGSIARLKAKPVFVDIDRETYNLDPDLLEAAITSRTKAIMPVHLFGLPAEMGKINEIARAHRLPVIEDAAQSIGARYHDKYVGNIGAFGCFSFFPSKNLGGAGDGGMITTNDPELAERICRAARSWQPQEISLRSAGDEQPPGQSASRHPAGEVQVPRSNAPRPAVAMPIGIANCFSRRVWRSVITLPVRPEGMRHVYNQFVIRTPKRDQLREYLAQLRHSHRDLLSFATSSAAGIRRSGLWRRCISAVGGSQPACSGAAVFPQMTEEQQKMVVQSVAQFFSERA